MMAAIDSELVVSWSPAMQAACARESQRQPPEESAPDATATDVVFAWIAAHPNTSMREIAAGAGLPPGRVNGALYSMFKRGRLVQSHRQRENRREPVRWRVA